MFFAHRDGGPEPAPDPDPGEVAGCLWVSWAAFRSVAATAPWALSLWVVEQLPRLAA